jgi:signal transduction histidine kinase
VEELTHLNEITRTVTSTLDQERIFDLLAARISKMFKVEAGSLLLLDEEAGELQFVTSWLSDHEPLRNIRLRLGQGIAGQVALLHGPVIVEDAYSDSRFYSQVDAATGFLTRSLLCVPLMVKERCIGVIELLNKIDGPFTENDVKCLTNIARPVAIALENARLYREAQKLHAAQSRFMATLAAELRSPLTAIKGYSDMALGTVTGDSDPLWVESVTSIQNRTDHLITLLEDLLDIARLEIGEGKLALISMPVQDIVTQVVSSFEQRLKEKDLTLTVQVAPNLPPVKADQDRMNQVLGSLVMNAYLYTLPKGVITIRAEMQQTGRPQSAEASSILQSLGDRRPGTRWVVVSVEDTGIGILSEDQARVFERFFRAEHPLVRSHSGRGLSLFIAKSLVELHGGHIWFDSVAGQGTTFCFSVLVADAQPSQEAHDLE